MKFFFFMFFILSSHNLQTLVTLSYAFCRCLIATAATIIIIIYGFNYCIKLREQLISCFLAVKIIFQWNHCTAYAMHTISSMKYECQLAPLTVYSLVQIGIAFFGVVSHSFFAALPLRFVVIFTLVSSCCRNDFVTFLVKNRMSNLAAKETNCRWRSNRCMSFHSNGWIAWVVQLMSRLISTISCIFLVISRHIPTYPPKRLIGQFACNCNVPHYVVQCKCTAIE